MNKQSSKYFSTAFLMDEALISLLDKKDIEYITIKEICEKAGVNRSTFYLHYENICDLVTEAMNCANKKFIDYFDVNTKYFISKLYILPLNKLNLVTREYLTPYLNFIKENKQIFKAAFKYPNNMDSENKLNSLNKYIITPILERFNIPKEERKYYVSFYLKGIMSIIEIWINNDCKEDIVDIEKIIMKCVGEIKY